MKLLYVFLNSVVTELCCFCDWGDWEDSPLTCGEVCKERRRHIYYADFFDPPWNCYCTSDYSTCPKYLSEYSYCDTIPCRELIF